MLCTVLGSGLERGGKTGYLIPANHCLHLRHIFSTPFSLPMTAVREVSQQLLIPQHRFPKLLMKQVLNRRTDTRNDLFPFSFYIPASCFSARSPDHLPPVPTGEVCPVCLELHHVQWRGGVHLPEQPVRLPVCGGIPAVQLPHHRHPDHGVHTSKHGQVLDRSL